MATANSAPMSSSLDPAAVLQDDPAKVGQMAAQVKAVPAAVNWRNASALPMQTRTAS
jgi:hypothetical protein